MEAKQNAKQRYYEKNKELYKERVRKQRDEKRKAPIQNNSENIDNTNQNNVKTRIEYILNFYSTIKKEYDFMIWVRNIKRVNKTLFSEIPSDKISENKDEIIPDESAFIDCIKSFLKTGERYVSLLPSKTCNSGVPIFFTIKEITEEIVITYVKIRFIKCGDGSAQFAPEWENTVKEIVIDNKNLHNIRLFRESENYKYSSYLEIRKDVLAFYK